MVNTGMWARQRSFVRIPTRKDLLLRVYYLILPHLCRCFLLMTAAAAVLPVWRLQLKVCVSSEGRPGADRHAPTYRYPAVALSRRPQKGPPEAAGSAVITPLQRRAPLTGSYLARLVGCIRRWPSWSAALVCDALLICLLSCVCSRHGNVKVHAHTAFTARRTPC